MANGHKAFNHVLELNKVNDKLINTIDFGSFKKSEDEGFNIRQINSNTLIRQLNNDTEFKFMN